MENQNRSDVVYDVGKVIFGVPVTSYLCALMLIVAHWFSHEMKIQIYIFAAVFSVLDTVYSAFIAVRGKHWLHPDFFTLLAVIGSFCFGYFFDGALAAVVCSAARGIVMTEMKDMRNTVTYAEDVEGFSEDTQQYLELMDTTPAPIERKVKKAGAWYSLICIFFILVLTVIVPLIWRVPFKEWMLRAFILLVAACPGCLSLCAEEEFYKCINLSAVRGVLYRNHGIVEAAASITSVAFGDRETVSEPGYRIAKIIPNEISNEELLMLAAYACAFSEDERAQSVLSASGIEVDKSKVELCKEIPGIGYAVIMGGIKVAAGSKELMNLLRVDVPSEQQFGDRLFVSAGRRYAGCLVLAKAGLPLDAEAVMNLKSIDLDRIVMISSRDGEEAVAVSKRLGIDEVFFGLSPAEMEEKLVNLRQMQLEYEKMAYVGDGYSDLTLMRRADIGISVGAKRHASSADIIIQKDESTALADALRLCENTRDNVQFNLILAGLFKAIIIVLALGGFGGIWLASLLDAFASVLVIQCVAGTQFRARKKKKNAATR